jgi:hypothetical protein
MAMFIFFVLNTVTAYLTFRTAERRGRSARTWAWLGMSFGPFAWLMVALLPPVRKEGIA